MITTDEKNNILSFLVKDNQKIEDLLKAIDEKATDENAYEYGLPLHNDNAKEALKLIVLRWVSDL